jgi:hypothetical protein
VREGVGISLVSEPDSCLYISGEGGIRDKEEVSKEEDRVLKLCKDLFAGRQQSRRQSGGL